MSFAREGGVEWKGACSSGGEICVVDYRVFVEGVVYGFSGVMIVRYGIIEILKCISIIYFAPMKLGFGMVSRNF